MEQDMTRGNPLSVIFMFTLPLAVGNIFQQLYNMADTIIVGRFVGADALAAVGSTGTIMFLLNGFAQGITAGFSVLNGPAVWCGKKGRGKRKRDQRRSFIYYRCHSFYCFRLWDHEPAAASDEYAG